MTPAEHDALTPAHEISAAFLERGIWMPFPQVQEVISALRQLADDPGTRPAVLVALGLGGEGDG